MFNDVFALTQAVLDGTKTMTRRVEKFEPSARLYDEVYNIEGGMNNKGQWIFTLFNKYGEIIGDIIPRYNVGEVVAIAQSYKEIGMYDVVGYNDYGQNMYAPIYAEHSAGWNNKLFVKADLMPHHIRITDVRMERLQEISEEDCLREGIYFYTQELAPYYPQYFAYDMTTDTKLLKSKTGFNGFWEAKDAYAALIDKISGKGTWNRNPWVVVYEFEKVD